MKENIEIFETAFVTADFRASDTKLSMDKYAHLWPTKRTRNYRNEYVNNVSKYEPLAHCLRNRFFLDYIKELYEQNKIQVLINFGCGFSMYPFLLPEGLSHIEIDMPDSISFKKEKIQSWQNSGILPKRHVDFLSANFNTEYQERLKKELEVLTKNKKTFILLEGVLFFISRNDTDKLFNFFGEIQSEEEYVGSVSFQKTIEQKTAFKRLEEFAEERLDFNEKFCYQTVEDSYYDNLINYQLLNHESTFTLNKKYTKKSLYFDELLDEHMYILKRK